MVLSEWAIVIPAICLGQSAADKLAEMTLFRRRTWARASAFAAFVVTSLAIAIANAHNPPSSFGHHLLLFALVFLCSCGAMGMMFLSLAFVDKRRAEKK